MVIQGELQRNASGIGDTDEATQRAGMAVVEKASAAVAAGIIPDSPGAGLPDADGDQSDGLAGAMAIAGPLRVGGR
jgi:hypothetical protein